MSPSMSFIDREPISVIRERFSLAWTGIHGVRGTRNG
jgi:hypothetical protein